MQGMRFEKYTEPFQPRFHPRFHSVAGMDNNEWMSEVGALRAEQL